MDKSIDGNMSEYFKHLPTKVVKDYNETVKCFEEFQAAIAIVEVGQTSQGSFSILSIQYKIHTTHAVNAQLDLTTGRNLENQ